MTSLLLQLFLPSIISLLILCALIGTRGPAVEGVTCVHQGKLKHFDQEIIQIIENMEIIQIIGNIETISTIRDQEKLCVCVCVCVCVWT